MKASDIHRAIDIATTRYRKPTLDQIIDVARELYPAEMAAAEARDMRRGTWDRFKNAQRQAVNITEDNPDAPLAQLEMFPGLPWPGYLSVDNCPIKSENANDFDVEEAVAQRYAKAAQIVRRAEDLDRKRAFRKKHERSRDETNAQIIARLQREIRQQRSIDDADGEQPTV